MAPPSRRGRKRKPVSHYTDDNPSTFTTKHKNNNGSAAKESPASSKSNHHHDTDSMTTPPRPRSTASRKRPLLDNEDDVKLMVHTHDMRLHSILPPNLLVHSSQNVSDVIFFGKGLGIPPPLPKPEWQLVSTPHMAAQAAISKESGEKKKLPPPPRLTCMDVSRDEAYMVVGNSLGQVLVYGLVPLVIHVATLETTASRRPQAPLTFKSKKRNEEHAIHCISMSSCSSKIVIATADEVECFDAVSGNLMWTHPLDDNNVKVTKLDIQETTHAVLASVVSAVDSLQSLSGPLWLLSYDEKDDTVVHVNKSLLDPSILKCAAMWDRSSNNRMVVVTTHENEEQPQELLLLNEDASVVHKTTLAICKTSKSMECISQSPQGMYTSVASSKGVRLFNTSTLELIHVYGEGLTLHGHAVIYQQATIFSKVPEQDYETGAGVLVLGIPHARREPRELQEQVQIWQWWDSVHPSHTLHGPPRSLGLVNLYASFQHDMLLALTHAGDVWMLSPTATTDWPGVMYPPGYNVISDNLVYIEDEDELDHVDVVDSTNVQHDEEYSREEEVLDDELAEALRISMLEQEQRSAVPKEEDVVVADFNDDDEHKRGIVIPCHPDPSLREAIEQNPNGLNSPKRVSTGDDVLLPACFLRQVLKTIPTREGATRSRPRVKALEAAPNIPTNKPTRGKRSRTGNLEAMIRASIDPDLQKFMTSKELWANGSGSTLRDFDQVSFEAENGTEQGPAILGKEEEEMGNAAVVTSAALTEQTQGDVAQSQTSVFRNVESTNGSLNGEAAPFRTDEEEALSKVIASRPMDDDATSALEAMLALHRSPSEDASPKKSSAAPRVPPVPHFESESSITTPRIDMIVTNSPAASLNPPTHVFAGTAVLQAMEVDTQVGASNGGLADLNGASGMATESEKPVVSQSEESSPNNESDKVDVNATNQVSQPAEANAPSPSFCGACRGRMVIHTCGKREVPVDVEAVERAEKERLEKEAEEKKRQRAEKRRKADARRREAKKKKKLEEERQRRIEEEQRRAEEEQRRAEEEEMERSRQQAEARLSEDHYERDRRRAEMWQRLMAANGGNRQDDGYGVQVDEQVQIDTSTTGHPSYPQPLERSAPATLNQVEQQPYEQTHGMQRINDVQQQPPYRQSYEQSVPVVNQSLHSSKQEQSRYGSHQISTSSVTAQAGYGLASPAQASATGYPASNQQLNSGQVQSTLASASSAAPFVDKQEETVAGQQYSALVTYPVQQQMAVPVGQNAGVLTSSVGQSDAEGTQQRDSPYEQSQTDNRSHGDEQAPPRPGLLERRTSAQLGTAEALASLASMCVQMPRAPTPQDSPHGTGVNGTTNSTSVVSQSQPSSSQIFAGESLNPSQPIVSGQAEPVTRDDAIASNTKTDLHARPLSTLTEQTSQDSQPLASQDGDSFLRQDVAGFNVNTNADSSTSASEQTNGERSQAEATALAALQEGPTKVTPVGNETLYTAGVGSQNEGNGPVQYVVAPGSSATSDASVQEDSQVKPVAENVTPPATAATEN